MKKVFVVAISKYFWSNQIKKQLCLVLSLCLVVSFFSLELVYSADKNNGSIRTVDFMNLSYPSKLCHKEYGRDGLGMNVKITNGEFQSKHGNNDNAYIYFGVVNNKILYGDLTGDGSEDAVVHIGCGLSTANYGLNEIYIYTYKNARESLLAHISDRDMDRDYKKYYKSSNDGLWFAINAIRINNGTLQIEKYSEGPHCCPEHITTLTYKLKGNALVLSKKPARKKVTSK